MRIFQHENGLFASKAFSGKRDGTRREAIDASHEDAIKALKWKSTAHIFIYPQGTTKRLIEQRRFMECVVRLCPPDIACRYMKQIHILAVILI